MGLELIPQNTKLFSLILTVPFSQSIHQSNTKVISNLKSLKSRLGKASIRKILTWWCFVKNSFLDSLFLVNFVFFLRIFYVFWKVPCMNLYSEKIGVRNGSQMMWDLFQTSALMQKNLSFIVFGTQACVRKLVYANACIKHAHTGLKHACAYTCMSTHALGFLWPLFSKNSFIQFKKELHFP